MASSSSSLSNRVLRVLTALVEKLFLFSSLKFLHVISNPLVNGYLSACLVGKVRLNFTLKGCPHHHVLVLLMNKTPIVVFSLFPRCHRTYHRGMHLSIDISLCRTHCHNLILLVPIETVTQSKRATIVKIQRFNLF